MDRNRVSGIYFPKYTLFYRIFSGYCLSTVGYVFTNRIGFIGTNKLGGGFKHFLFVTPI